MTRGEKVIAFAERHLLVPDGALVGKPMKLLPFQKKFILDVYDNPKGTKKAILSTARKNGKTATIAILLLAHLVGTEARKNSQIISGAMSREQAALVFELARKMVMLSPTLRNIVRVIPSKKMLVGLPMNVEYRAIAAEGKTAQGLSPVLAILDETGQVSGTKNSFVDAVVTSQGAHEAPMLFVISTQAANDGDLLSVWIDDAIRGHDPHTVCHLYAAPQDADLMDKEGWKAANPALGMFRNLKDLEEQMRQAARMPSAENTARNLLLNQRVSSYSLFISRNSWNDCRGDVPPLADCVQVFGGLDLSAKTDLTAFVLVGTIGDGKWHVYPHFWMPQNGLFDRVKRDKVQYDAWVKAGYIQTTIGTAIDYEFVARTIIDLTMGVNLTAIAYDRWRMDILKKELERLGVELPLVDWGQGFKDMSPALDALEGRILNKTLCHDGNPVLTMCAANAVMTKSPAGDRKLDKSKTSGRIDGMVALAMACGISEKEMNLEGRMDDFIFNPLVLS